MTQPKGRRWSVTEFKLGDNRAGGIVGPFVRGKWYAHAWRHSRPGNDLLRYDMPSKRAAKRAVERWLERATSAGEKSKPRKRTSAGGSP